jgi:hypothetical protein
MDTDAGSIAAMVQLNTPAGMACFEVQPGHPATYTPSLYVVKNGAVTLVSAT